VPLCLGTIGKLARAGAHPIDGFQEIAKVTGMAEVKVRCCHDGGPPEGDIPTPIRLLSIDHAVCQALLDTCVTSSAESARLIYFRPGREDMRRMTRLDAP